MEWDDSLDLNGGVLNLHINMSRDRGDVSGSVNDTIPSSTMYCLVPIVGSSGSQHGFGRSQSTTNMLLFLLVQFEPT